MALSQSGSYQGDISRSNSYWMYALRRDDEGMLHLTKVSSASTESNIDVGVRYDGTQVPEFGDLQDYVLETTPEKSLTNHPQDKYQQFRFDSRNLNYYIDDDGYFILKVTGTHTYSGPV
jgi:hypothetical protein|tara:strand:+ start:936 stop:1292 length:357 start_codon:yes stop_codon:yes gene_type:complete